MLTFISPEYRHVLLTTENFFSSLVSNVKFQMTTALHIAAFHNLCFAYIFQHLLCYYMYIYCYILTHFFLKWIKVKLILATAYSCAKTWMDTIHVWPLLPFTNTVLLKSTPRKKYPPPIFDLLQLKKIVFWIKFVIPRGSIERMVKSSQKYNRNLVKCLNCHY